MSDQALDPETTKRLQRLCALAAEQADIDVPAVTPDSDFFTDLNFDSLDAVEFTMRVEEEFDVSVPDEAVQHVRTPRGALELLAKASSTSS